MKNFNLLLVLVTALVWSANIEAQIADTNSIKIEDGWIENMSNKLTFDVSFNNLYNTFEVQSAFNKIILYPNTPNNLKLKFSYDFISVGFQFSPDFIPGNGDNDIKGNTKAYNLGTSIIIKHWFANLSYSKIKGYYLFNTSDYMIWNEGDPYVQFPDLQYNGFSFQAGYYKNSKFSFKSITSQTERQLKSAGSFISVFSLDYHIVDNKSNTPNTQKSNNVEASIGPGYAYTFVVKEKLYLSLSSHASIGYLNTKVTTRFVDGDLISNQDNYIFRWNGKIGIGYNGRKFYSGLYTDVSEARYKQENSTVVNFETRVFYHLFIGYRINSPEFLEKNVKRIKDKFFSIF